MCRILPLQEIRGDGTLARRLKQLRPQQVLFYQGDSGSEMFVVLRGRVKLVDGREDDGQVDVVEMSNGEFFGEMALVTNAPRTRTAIAVESTTLLCINRIELNQLVREQPATAARILNALDRRGAENRQSAERTAELDDPNAIALRGEVGDPRYLFLRLFTCPLCETRFQAEVVRDSRLQVAMRQPDFRIKYKDVEPLWYRYVVCPKCMYAAKRSEFESGELREKQKEDLILNQAQRTGRFGIFDFAQARDASLGIVSVQLAELCYTVAERSAIDRAGVALTLMWLYDDSGNKPELNQALARATELYVEAYQNDPEARDSKTDQRLAYLIGWLSHRLYKTKQAMTYLAKAVQLEREGDKAVSALVRDLLPSIRKRHMEAERGASRIEKGETPSA